MPALAVHVDRAHGPTNHHSHERGSRIPAHSAADYGSGNASDDTSAVVTSEGTSHRVRFDLRGRDLGDVVSSVLLDDLRKIRDLPIGHEHAVWSHAHVFLHRELAAFLRGQKIFRVG